MIGIPQCKWCKQCKWCTHMIVIVVDEKVYPSVNDVNAINGVRNYGELQISQNL